MRMINNVVVVDMGQFGILDETDQSRYLVTRYTSDCTGLALVSDDKRISALLHVQSSRYYIHSSEDDVALHAKRLWQEFAEALKRKSPDSQNFSASLFGVMPARCPWEDAKKYGTGIAPAAAVSSCLNRHFIMAANKSVSIQIIQDRRMTGQSQSCIVDKVTGTMRVTPDRVRDPLIEAMTSPSRVYGPGTAFKDVLKLHR